MDLQEVVAASRVVDGQLLLRAQRLAGMLHKVKHSHCGETSSHRHLLDNV
jgi:hypothetical protein